MIASNYQHPRISDWSTASLESLENRNAWTSGSAEPVNTNQIHKDDPHPHPLVNSDILSFFEKKTGKFHVDQQSVVRISVHVFKVYYWLSCQM